VLEARVFGARRAVQPDLRAFRRSPCLRYPCYEDVNLVCRCTLCILSVAASSASQAILTRLSGRLRYVRLTMVDSSWLRWLMRNRWARSSQRSAVVLLVSGSSVRGRPLAQSETLAVSEFLDVKDVLDSPMACSQGTRSLQLLHLL
jgi:hypothetical protein